MIEVTEINQSASFWGVPPETIERDFALGWLLWALANSPAFQRTLVFRGGTCLKKCYVDTHRFSEDLDFAVFKESAPSLEVVKAQVPGVLTAASSASGINFQARDPVYETSRDRIAIHVKLYFIGPRRTPTPISIKLDIELEEVLARPPILRKIGHPYSDTLPAPDAVYCYGMEELFAEKLRALGERYRPRDLYDSVYLFRRSDIHAEAALVQEVLAAKCQSKGVTPPSLDRLSSQECADELRTSWESMLGHQLGQLPLFEDYFGELKRLFAWLDGTLLTHDELEPIADDDQWSPPQVEWQPGQKDRLEPVRFAAVNRLCLDLGYQNSQRVIEPYSLRHTHAGHILLYGIRSDNRQLRAYRVDRIESIVVTAQNFKPAFRVEFSPQGRLSAPPTRRPVRVPAARRAARRSRRGVGMSSTTYVIQCTACGRTFRRQQYDLSLRPHKDPSSGYSCYGTIGMHVDTEY